MRKRKPVSPSLLDKQHGQEVIEVRHLFIRARNHRAVIEEAWRQAGRRRLIYAVLVLLAAALTFVSGAAGTSTEPKQLDTTTSKAGADHLPWLC